MATINTAGGNTTLTLSYTASNAKMLNFINDALDHLYPDGIQLNDEVDEDGEPILTPIADLTNQQKAAIVELKCKEYIKNLASSRYVNQAGETARETATTETATRYE